VVIVLRGSYQRYQEAQGAVLINGTALVPLSYSVLIMPLFVLAVFKLSAERYSAFLYFQF
jgi:hypothetical protein